MKKYEIIIEDFLDSSTSPNFLSRLTLEEAKTLMVMYEIGKRNEDITSYTVKDIEERVSGFSHIKKNEDIAYLNNKSNIRSHMENTLSKLKKL